MSIGAVVLAAGMAVRMGRQKLLLPLDGKPMLAYVLEIVAAVPLASRIVVIGEPAEALTALCQEQGIPSVFNEKRRSGQASSVRLGLSQLASGLDGVIFLQGDQPLLTESLLKRMLEQFQQLNDPKVILAPVHAGVLRSPLLFGSHWLEELSLLEEDRGGKELVRRYPEHVRTLPWAEPFVFEDADTWEEYLRLQQLLQTQSKG
nr:nucleotidyltransferase family protein [uncultured Anaeromusa sp.]